MIRGRGNQRLIWSYIFAPIQRGTLGAPRARQVTRSGYIDRSQPGDLRRVEETESEVGVPS